MKPRSLKRKSEFTKIYEEGQKLVSRSLVLYRLPAENNARSVVASRKIGGAVQRNRAKRLLREALRKINLPETNSTGPGNNRRTAIGSTGNAQPEQKLSGLWVVVVARRNVLSLGIRDLELELGCLLSGQRTSIDSSRHGTPDP